MEATTTVWLTKPEPPQDADSVAVMRWAIEQDAAREGSLAAECLAAARAAGLSAEDTFVFLAYQALLRVEEHHMYLSDIAPCIEASEDTEASAPGVATRLASHVRNAVERVERALRPDRPAPPANTAPSGPG